MIAAVAGAIKRATGKQQHHAPPTKKTCAYLKCGRKFKPKRRDQIYCCNECGKKANDARCKRRYRRGESGYCLYCKQCGKAFDAKRRNAKYCSNVCRLRYTYKPRWDRSERRCSVCRGKFIPTQRTQVYCDSDCKRYGDYDRFLRRKKRRRCNRRASPAVEAKRLSVLRAEKLEEAARNENFVKPLAARAENTVPVMVHHGLPGSGL